MPSEQDSQPKPAKRARTSFTAEQLQVPERAGGRARRAWEWPGAPRGGELAPQGDGAELRMPGAWPPGRWLPLGQGSSLTTRPQVMQAQFAQDNNPDAQTLQKLADMTGLSRRVIQVRWASRGRAWRHPRAGPPVRGQARLSPGAHGERADPGSHPRVSEPFREAEGPEAVVAGVVSKLPGAA